MELAKIITAEKFIDLLKENNMYDEWKKGFQFFHREGKKPETEEKVIQSLNFLKIGAKSKMWLIPFLFTKEICNLTVENLVTFADKLIEANEFPEVIAHEINFTNALNETDKKEINDYCSKDFIEILKEEFDDTNESSLKLFEGIIKSNLTKKIVLLEIMHARDSIASYLFHAFNWGNTDEGPDYWNKVDHDLEKYIVDNYQPETAEIFRRTKAKEMLNKLMTEMFGKKE